MPNRLSVILVAVSVAFVANAARADLSVAVLPGMSPHVETSISSAGDWAFTYPQITALDAFSLTIPLALPDSGLAESSSEATDVPTIATELPPCRPGSAGLFLSAMISVGAWQLVRSAKHLNLAHVPDWYHTGAPDQIGSTFILNLDFAAMADCPFDTAEGKPHTYWRIPPESRLRLEPQLALLPSDPPAVLPPAPFSTASIRCLVHWASRRRPHPHC